MYPVTPAFDRSMRSAVRRIRGKVVIDYTDPVLDQSIIISASENAIVSFPSQTADGFNAPSRKWASLDGSTVPDGTYYPAPETEEQARTRQIGWWGKYVSDENGNFSEPYPTLTIEHLPRPIHSAIVVGDSLRGEYPVDFELAMFDTDDEEVYWKAVTGNDQVSWEDLSPSPFFPVLDIVRQVLTIKKWSHPGRQAKIVEFFTSIQRTYLDNDIMLIRLIEEKDVSQGSLPIGNIASNEVEIRLNNVQKDFDPANPRSPLRNLLKPNRRIRPYLGVRYPDDSEEWVPLGLFWSGDWRASLTGISTTIVARDRLDRMRSTFYSPSKVYEEESVKVLAEHILMDAGLELEEYWVDDSLGDVVIPWAYFPSSSHTESLRLLAEACMGQVYCDREGVVRFESFGYVSGESSGIRHRFVSPGFPSIGNQSSVYGIGLSDYFRKDNPALWTHVANRVIVETNPLRVSEEQNIYQTPDPIMVEEGISTIEVPFFQTPCLDCSVELDDGPLGSSISLISFTPDIAVVEIDAPEAGTVSFALKGRILQSCPKERIVTQDDTSVMENGALLYEFPDNPFIQTKEQATAIADALLTSYKDPRNDLSIEWRGNPALLLGDTVLISEYRDTQYDVRSQFRITKQEMRFDGGFRMWSDGRRIPTDG